MSWLKLDDGMVTHRKMFEAARILGGRQAMPRCIALYVEALAFASKSLTNGYVSGHMVRRFASDSRPKPVIKALAEAGLFDDLNDDGFWIHDYLDWNQSSQEILDRRAKDRARKRGGFRAESARNPDDDPSGIQTHSRARVPSRPISSTPKCGVHISEVEAPSTTAPHTTELSENLTPVVACLRLWEARWPGELRQCSPKTLLELQRHGKHLGQRELEERFRRFLASADPKVVAKRHPIEWFVRQVSQWGPPPKSESTIARASRRFLSAGDPAS